VTGLSRGVMLAALPVLLGQGRAAHRNIPRLPDAEGRSGLAGTGRPSSSVLVVGDSVAAGVGVDHQVNCLAGRLASRLAAATDRTVAWSVLAQTGAKASDVRRLVEAAGTLADPDLVVLSVGVNDVKGLTSDRAWTREFGTLLDVLADKAPRADLVWIGVPPMHEFPTLPMMLARLMGGRASRLDALGERVLANRPRVRRISLGIDVLDRAFAADGFHPSTVAHDRIAEEILRG
jgi:lysophospholipase L1-like esterase